MEKRCKTIDHPNLMPGGWGCCECAVYNGGQRTECKNCGHERCYFPKIVIDATVDKKNLN